METKRILLTGKICGDAFEWHIAPLPATDETKLVSRYMNRHGFLDMQSNYELDGYQAACEGQPLAAMPTEYHETGWWRAQWSGARIEPLSEQEEARMDEEFNRRGC